jgi:hypothetical protein
MRKGQTTRRWPEKGRERATDVPGKMPGTARKMRALPKLPFPNAPESVGSARFQRAGFCILQKPLSQTSLRHLKPPDSLQTHSLATPGGGAAFGLR